MKILFTQVALLLMLLLISFGCNEDAPTIESGKEITRRSEISYFHDGKRSVEINYKNDKRDSVYREWFPSGGLQVEKYYQDGEEVSGKLFTLEGKVIKNYVFKNGRVYGLLNSSWCLNGLVQSADKDSMVLNPKTTL